MTEFPLSQNDVAEIRRPGGGLSTLLGRVKIGLAAVLIVSLCINMLMLATPLYMALVVDQVLASGNLATLGYLTLIAAGAYAVLAGSVYFRPKILVAVGVWFEQQISGSVLQQHLQLAVQNRVNDSAQGLRDVAIVRNFLTGPDASPILDTVWIPVFLIAILLLSPVLGGIAIAGAIALVLLAVLTDWAVRKPMQRSARASIDGLRLSGAAVKNADTVIAMGFEDNIVKRWAVSNNRALDGMAGAGGRASALFSLSIFLRYGLQVAIAGVAAILVIQDELTLGGMFATFILLGSALGPLNRTIGGWRNAAAAKAAFRRITNILADSDDEDEDSIQLPALTGAVSIENVSYAYGQDGHTVLQDISFKLKPGETLGIVGPTAVGKSSLAWLLVGLDAPSEGQVRLDGIDISLLRAKELGRYLGYLPQEIELFEGTVRENIARFGKAGEMEVVSAARAARAHEMILRLGHGYETLIGENGAALSGGTRQRVALARTLLSDPKIAVLDEPNASLDVVGDNALISALNDRFARGLTTIIISHRPSILKNADKLLILNQGGTAEFGYCETLFNKVNQPFSVLTQADAAEVNA